VQTSGGQKKVWVDGDTYTKLKPGMTIRRDARGTIVVVREESE